MVNEAPGLFSTTKATPICALSCCVRMRIRTSGEPPAADGMTKRIGFSGYPAAAPALQAKSSRANKTLRTLQCFGGVHSEVRKNAVGARSLESDQRLHDAGFGQPAVADRGA